MIWTIVRKELLVNLLSLRFALGLVITVAMMGIVSYVLLQDYVARRQTYIAEVQQHQEELAQTKVYSRIELTVDFPPSPLSIFSRGAKDLPGSVTVSPYQIPSLVESEAREEGFNLEGTSDRPYNPLLRVFNTIDLAFVVSTILSLFAVLLVFDSFSGEREQGTLSLLMANPVGRLEVLAAKFLGALVTLAIPLTLGFLEVLLLWSLSAEVVMDRQVWAGTGMLYLVSLVFLSGFLGLGLLVSLCVHESSAGLIYILLVWVGMVVVVPEGGKYLSQFFKPQVTRQQVLEEAEKAYSEFGQTSRKIPYQEVAPCCYGDSWQSDTRGEQFLGTLEAEVRNRVEYNKKVFPLKFRYAEQRFRLFDQYAAALRRWRGIGEDLMRPSLCSLYQNIAQGLAGADVESYETALRQALQYREDLMAYLLPKVGTPEWVTRILEHPEMQPTEENLKLWKERQEREGERVIQEKIVIWDRVGPLDLSAMPKPRIGHPDLGARLAQVGGDLALLAGFAVLLLALAARRAGRYYVG